MKQPSIALVLLSSPIAMAILWLALVAAGERRGGHPFSAPPLRNSAEAAATGDAAAVLRFLRMGDDPTRIHLVRPEIISSQILKVTTVEAAMWSQHFEMIQLLDQEGAIVDPDQRRELACLAADRDMPEVAAYLAADVQCVRGAAIDRIIARSKPPTSN
jgi:hypothetical protein